MIADLYDFDKTIFLGESGTEFYLFCLKNQPEILRFLPQQVRYAFKYFVEKKVTMEQMKEKVYSCLNGVDGEKMIELFWKKNENRICPWFKERDKDVATIVCSASPVFQIKPICDKLGVDLIISTDIDIHTGKITGKNCKGAEKVERIKKDASEYTIRDAYTDNLKSDAPLLSLATRYKYEVKNGARMQIFD